MLAYLNAVEEETGTSCWGKSGNNRTRKRRLWRNGKWHSSKHK